MAVEKKKVMPEPKKAEYLFINKKDPLAQEINARAIELYTKLSTLDVNVLDTDPQYRDYFSKHHSGRRLFFSIQNSAHIIYHSVKKAGKAVNETSFMDYGAGLGTLFILAGMMGFRKTVYNDYFAEWHQPAKALCSLLQVKIDDYVSGDIEAVTTHAAANNITYDIFASRNVLEHIYNLSHFYKCIYAHNSNAVSYSTTTANFHNPAMRWYHVYLHKKWEKLVYRNQRINEIKKIFPLIQDNELGILAEQTRGKAQKDFVQVVDDFKAGIPFKKDSSLKSNSCDCITGVWNEHLLSKKEYEAIISAEGFKMEYTPGFWDTHYSSFLMNIAATFFNRMITLSGNRGTLFSPFVNVIAYN